MMQDIYTKIKQNNFADTNGLILTEPENELALQNLANELSEHFLIYELNEFLNSDFHKLRNLEKSMRALNKIVFVYMTISEYDQIQKHNLEMSSYLFPWILCEPIVPNLFCVLNALVDQFKDSEKEWHMPAGFHRGKIRLLS